MNLLKKELEKLIPEAQQDIKTLIKNKCESQISTVSFANSIGYKNSTVGLTTLPLILITSVCSIILDANKSRALAAAIINKCFIFNG